MIGSALAFLLPVPCSGIGSPGEPASIAVTPPFPASAPDPSPDPLGWGAAAG